MPTPVTQASTVDQPLSLPLVATAGNRYESRNQDARIINAFVEQDVQTKDIWVYKRPGLLKQSTVAANAAGQGVWNWKGDVYSIFGGNLYKNGVLVGAVDGTNGAYRFVQIRGTPGYLVMGNGVKAYYYDGTTLTQITDASFPSTFVKGWAYLDGTLYVMDAQANIWGSQTFDNPITWDPLNKIVARIEPDGGVALAKQLVYVVALKEWTTEVFYDAGNATGSPLGSVQGAKSPFGCISADSVQEIDDNLLWLTANRTASPQVAMMSNLQTQIISTAPIERQLENLDYTTVLSWVFKHGGHRYYGLTSVQGNVTLVYDLDQAIWYQWTDTNGNYWPMLGMTFSSTRQHIVQHMSNGNLYLLEGDYDYPTDDGAIITVDLYTPNFTGGVDKRKFLKLMRVNADQASSTSLLQMRWSEDDYQTWNNFRTVDLSKQRPFWADLGSFYRRAFHFRHAAAVPFRIKSVDLMMDLGTF